MNSTSRIRTVLAVLMIGLCCCGCSNFFASSATTSATGGQTPGQPEKVVFPPLENTSTQPEPGIVRYEAVLQRAGVPMKVWIYTPQGPKENLPCVLVGPAGSHLVDGMRLDKGDEEEHLPYVRAGFVVVSFEIDGAWPAGVQKASPQVQIVAARAFKEAHAGVLNASAALDYALAKVPGIDPQRIYVAGHSSAATLALLVASSDQRIKACAAYAPVTNVESHVGPLVIREFNISIPGFTEFMKTSSPASHLADLRCPIFLFHAQDDNVVPVIQTRIFVANLKTSNTKVKYVEAASGGHHDGMIKSGIPQAIKWFQTLSN
jgi:dipeptidyl aminopeptidase/acylaminoacyl peptidase